MSILTEQTYGEIDEGGELPSFQGQKLSWIDAALENLILISSRHSGPEAHARLRRIKKRRKPADREELLKIVREARVDDDETLTLEVQAKRVEYLLLSAAAVILASEELSTRCMTEMCKLQCVAASWEWLSKQPKRMAVAAWFMSGKNIHEMYLECDQQRDEARSQRETMARTLARLRRGVSFWDSVVSLPRLHTALTRHLDIVETLAQPDSLDELYERIMEPPPHAVNSDIRNEANSDVNLREREEGGHCGTHAHTSHAHTSPSASPQPLNVHRAGGVSWMHAAAVANATAQTQHTATPPSPLHTGSPRSSHSHAYASAAQPAGIPRSSPSLASSAAAFLSAVPPLSKSFTASGGGVTLWGGGGALSLSSCLPPHTPPLNSMPMHSQHSQHALQISDNPASIRRLLDRMRTLSERLPSAFALVSSASAHVTRPPLVYRVWPAASVALASATLILRGYGPAHLFEEVGQIVTSLWSAAETLVKDHFEEPTREIYKELFLQQHDRGVSAWKLQAQISRDSLERMIETFRSKVGGNVPVLTKSDTSPAAIANLDLVMRIYEEQVKSPVSSMLFGDMLQALLIQMQSLKVNMEEEATAMHALMKANQLSLQMMAAVPAVLFGAVVTVAIRRLWLWVRREPAHPRRRFTQLVRQAERLLIECQQSGDAPEYPHAHRYNRAAEEGLSEELLGSLCYLVQVMDRTVGAMYLTSESKNLIRLDLSQAIRFKTSVDQRLSLLHSLLRDLPSLV